MRIEHAFRVAATPDAIFVHLADPANYVGLSPLVVAVRDVTLGDGVTSYRAVERSLLFGKLPYDNVIAVTMIADAGALTVSGEARRPGWVRVAYRFEIRPAAVGGGAVVTESLLLRAPLGRRRSAADRAREVQLARARILAERLAHA